MLLTLDFVTFLCCDIAFGTGIYRTLDECPLISSLPGKTLRTLVAIARLVKI